MNQISWTTEKRKLSDLVPHESNPRKLSKKKRDELKKSLDKFDLAEIPAITTNNTLLAGHQRCQLLVELKGSDYEIDVRVPNRELTKAEEKEYLVRSNKNTGDFDFDLLEEFFEKDDLVGWGFEENEVLNFDIDFKGAMKIANELMDNNSDDRQNGKKLNLIQCPDCGCEFKR